MAVYNNEQITPREYDTWQHDKDMLELQMSHAKEMKQLELEVMKIEARFNSWLKIPLFILKLPVLILFTIPMTVYAVTHQEIPEFYQRFFR